MMSYSSKEMKMYFVSIFVLKESKKSYSSNDVIEKMGNFRNFIEIDDLINWWHHQFCTF